MLALMSFEKLASLQRKCAEDDVVPEQLFDLVRNLFLQSESGSPFLEKDSSPPRALERFGFVSRLVIFETKGRNSSNFFQKTFLPQGHLQEQVALRLRKSELEIDYFAQGSEHSAMKQVGLQIEELPASKELAVSAYCRGYSDSAYTAYTDSNDGEQYERAVAGILVERLTSFMDRCEMIQVD